MTLFKRICNGAQTCIKSGSLKEVWDVGIEFLNSAALELGEKNYAH